MTQLPSKLLDSIIGPLLHFWPSRLVTPWARRSYQALSVELKAQFEALPVKVEFVQEDPYGPNSDKMRRSVASTGILKIWAGGVSGHPAWSEEELLTFRAVHDYIGHIQSGASFSRTGEHMAYKAHKATLSKKSQHALWSETEAQQAHYRTLKTFSTQKALF